MCQWLNQNEPPLFFSSVNSISSMKYTSNLLNILNYMRKVHSKERQKNYYIPSLWLQDNSAKAIKVNAYEFFIERIENILRNRCFFSQHDGVNYNQSLSLIKKERHGIGGDWTLYASIYNMFPRLTTAFDHNQDRKIGEYGHSDITLNSDGIRETGTFLKCIAILPYIKSLGINTVYLLPVSEIGKDGRKGDLGSPYAIKNPYNIEDTLADPIIPFSAKEQFAAFVEASHILEIRVVVEFVFRTTAKDSDWIKDHPEWFYWIDADIKDNEFNSPQFTKKEMEEILKIPEGKGRYIPPHNDYKAQFKKPPKPEQVKMFKGKYLAQSDESVSGWLKIPGAFADWPPNDVQSAWTDVTYLRMYNFDYDAEENYNYIAYNTIRYYDPKLAKPKNANKPLWEAIKNIILYYQKHFGIDGVMIDMGHALPSELRKQIIKTARDNNPDFAVWSEDFNTDIHHTRELRKEGYNAIVGDIWAVENNRQWLEKIIKKTTQKHYLPFFGTSETHNTPRTAYKKGIAHSKLTYFINNYLPNCIPFIHTGFELCEKLPINTGLNFTPKEIKYFSTQKLPLFYKSSLSWLTKTNIVDFIKKVSEIREKYRRLCIEY